MTIVAATRAALDDLVARAAIAAQITVPIAEGNTTIATPHGTITIADELDLAPGSAVELKLVSSTPPTVTVRHLPVQSAVAGPKLASVPPNPPDMVELGPPIQATVVAPAPGRGLVVARGARLLLRIIAIELPASDDAAAVHPASPTPLPEADGNPSSAAEPTGLQPVTVATASEPPVPVASAPHADTSAAAAAKPQVMSALAVDRTSTTQSGAKPSQTIEAPAAPPRAAAPVAITGIVLPGRTVRPLLTTPLGKLEIGTANLPAGSRVSFLLHDPAVLPLPPTAPDAIEMPRALEEALAAIASVAPDLAQAMRGDLQPQAPTRFAATVLFLIAAMRGREPAARWPGDAADAALEQAGRADLSAKITAGPDEASRQPASGAWQTFVIPLYEGAQPRQAMLYLERRDHGEHSGASRNGSRFVFEVETQRLGALQFDGRLRPRHFGLLLRSRADLGTGIKRDITRIFGNAVSAAGWSGDIAFTVTPVFPVAPSQSDRPRVSRLA